MSHPENSKAPSPAQLLITNRPAFANMGHGALLQVQGGVPINEALSLSRTLSGGLQCIQQRLADLVDQGEELGYVDELRTLEFISEVIVALVQAAEVSLASAGGAQ